MFVKQALVGALWILGVYIVVYGATQVYQSLDSAGWSTHNRDTTVFIEGNWWVGEHRTCYGNIAGVRDNTNLGCSSPSGRSGDFAWSSFPVHVLPVEYHGRIDRHNELIMWDCQRKEASLVCKAINWEKR